MFAKVKNRKRALVYILLAVALIAAGITYAWFTASTTPTNNKVVLGDLGIEGTFEADTGDFLYEPGLEINPEGTVKNTGTLPFIAKLTLDSVSTLVRDANGDPLPAGQTITRTNDDNIKVDFNEGELYSKIYPDGRVHIWTMDADGNYYLILDPGLELDVSFLAVLDGDKLGNEYMNSTISFDSSWYATQVMPGAVQSAWGDDVDLDDLMANIYPIQTNGRMMTAAASDPNAYLAEYLENLFNR